MGNGVVAYLSGRGMFGGGGFVDFVVVERTVGFSTNSLMNRNSGCFLHRGEQDLDLEYIKPNSNFCMPLANSILASEGLYSYLLQRWWICLVVGNLRVGIEDGDIWSVLFVGEYGLGISDAVACWEWERVFVGDGES